MHELRDRALSDDGNPAKDIVIAAGCQAVQLRAERDQAKNGRVYTVTLRVPDAAGNRTRRDLRVSVPVTQGDPVVQDGPALTVPGSCP